MPSYLPLYRTASMRNYYQLGKRKQRRIQESLETKAIKLNSKAHSSTSFMSISVVIHYLNQAKEKSDCSRFYQYTSIAARNILLISAVFIALFHLIQFCFWNYNAVYVHFLSQLRQWFLLVLSTIKGSWKVFRWDRKHCQESVICIH